MRLSAGEWIVIVGSALIVLFAGVVGTLIFLKPPPIQFEYLETAATRQGEALYRREGCFSCHEIFGNGASYGPSLDGVGSKRNKQWLINYMKSPRQGVSVKPYRLKMPPYDHIQENELALLAEYLMALRDASDPG